MKKRVLCITLALLMVFPLVFAAFADDDDPKPLDDLELNSTEVDPHTICGSRLLVNGQKYEDYNEKHGTHIYLQDWGVPSDGMNDTGLDYQSNDVVIFSPYFQMSGYEEFFYYEFYNGGINYYFTYVYFMLAFMIFVNIIYSL